jgi:hypothetical protein
MKMRGYFKLVFAMSYVGDLNIQDRKGHLRIFYNGRGVQFFRKRNIPNAYYHH